MGLLYRLFKYVSASFTSVSSSIKPFQPVLMTSFGKVRKTCKQQSREALFTGWSSRHRQYMANLQKNGPVLYFLSLYNSLLCKNGNALPSCLKFVVVWKPGGTCRVAIVSYVLCQVYCVYGEGERTFWLIVCSCKKEQCNVIQGRFCNHSIFGVALWALVLLYLRDHF